MNKRIRTGLAVFLLGSGCGWTVACAPYTPPTTVPATPSPEFEPLRAAVKSYLDATQASRRDAAAASDAVPVQALASGTDDAVRLRQRVLAEAIRTRVRPGAREGDILSPGVADLIRRQLTAAFAGPKGRLIRSGLQAQNEGLGAEGLPVEVNQVLNVPRVPPALVEVLPELPPQLEFAFSGRTVVMRDVDAELVVDFISNAFPESPLAGEARTASPAPERAGSAPLLALPGLVGSSSFAVIGDGGSGDAAQQAVADAMLRYFTEVRPFPTVIMVGDNLYDDDYVGEFAVPYAGLLERGVLFHAALGNHDQELEQHYKPFHMNDRLYYAFTEGNARFVVLNSNKPGDSAQLAWFNTAFGDTGNKWRIGVLHHPLYSSGNHADQTRDIIRPQLEPALVRNRVDLVFSGHDHLYERIAPQRGIRYFVSGGAGKDLYTFHRSAFDEAGASEHHFMMVEIAGDQLFFEAIDAGGGTLDCGVLWRTAAAAALPAGAATHAWQEACAAALASRASGRRAAR